jgi:hypothetical protein
MKSYNLQITGGCSKKIKLRGSKAIYKATIDDKVGNMDEVLRKLILQINWDNADQPAV